MNINIYLYLSIYLSKDLGSVTFFFLLLFLKLMFIKRSLFYSPIYLFNQRSSKNSNIENKSFLFEYIANNCNLFL